MKFCGNCGNEMEDDMLFCTKCGTKFENTINNNTNNIVSKIKQYNLIIYKDNCSWQYVNDNFEKIVKIIDKQNSLCEEFKELLYNTLNEYENLSFEERKDIYLYTLNMLIEMCNESSKMFSDYSGLKELFETNKNILFAKEFLDFIMNADMNYKVIAGFQMQLVSDIKNILDEEVIKKDEELRNITFQLAQSFNDMWYSRIKRFKDFFLSPSEEDIDMHWRFYLSCLKGLYQFEIENLNENGWDIALDDGVKNHNRFDYKEAFNEKRFIEKEKRIRKDFEDKKKFFFELHPEEYNYYKENESKYESLKKSEINTINIIDELNNKIAMYNKKINENKQKLDDKSNKLLHLKKSIWGEKLTQNKKDNLNKEIEKLKKELEDLELKMFDLERTKEKQNQSILNIKSEKEKIEKIFKQFNFDEILQNTL